MSLKRSSFIFLLLAVQTVLPCLSIAQRPGPPPQSPRSNASETSSGIADLVVHLQDEKKAAFFQTAKVSLRNSRGDLRGTTISEKGRAAFHGVPLDSYEVAVEV